MYILPSISLIIRFILFVLRYNQHMVRIELKHIYVCMVHEQKYTYSLVGSSRNVRARESSVWLISTLIRKVLKHSPFSPSKFVHRCRCEDRVCTLLWNKYSIVVRNIIARTLIQITTLRMDTSRRRRQNGELCCCLRPIIRLWGVTTAIGETPTTEVICNPNVVCMHRRPACTESHPNHESTTRWTAN